MISSNNSGEGQALSPTRSWIRSYCIVAVAYLIITLFFTYPLILNPAKKYIESPIGSSNDQFVAMWDAWWVKKALLELHTSPLSTPYLGYPDGADLSLHELTIANSVITIPFQILLPKPYGLVLGFNVTILLSFVLAGVGAYALFNYLTRNPFAAFVGGLAFAFAPYRTMHIVHIALLSTGWFPLYLLFLLKAIREPRFLNACLAGLCILLTLYSCMSYIYFTFLATIIVLGYYAVFDRKEFFRKPVLLSLAMVGLLGATVAIPHSLLALMAGGTFKQPYDMIEFFSANVVGYFLPASKHFLFRPLYGLLPPFSISGVPGEATFLGYTLLALAVVGIWKARPAQWGLWALMASFFFVLSLGPSLHLFGQSYNITLPYAFFHEYLPFFSVMRTPYRFAVFVTLAIAAVACYGLDALSGRPGESEGGESPSKGASRMRGVVLPAIVGSLLMLELWNIPFAAKEVVVPDVYFELAKEEGEFGVLDLPRDKYRKVADYMMYQTVHEKPIAMGLISRRTEKQEQMQAIITSPRYMRPDDLTGEDLEWLRSKGFRYVIYHSMTDEKDTILSVLRL